MKQFWHVPKHDRVKQCAVLAGITCLPAYPPSAGAAPVHGAQLLAESESSASQIDGHLSSASASRLIAEDIGPGIPIGKG